MRTSLGHPVGIDNSALSFTRIIVEPMPGFGVDGFSDGSKDTQGRQVVVLDVFFTHSSKESDCSWGSVELSGLPFIDKVPISRWSRVDWGGFEYSSGDSVQKRTVDDISMTSDPSDIRHAGELVVWVNVKDVFDGKLGAEEVSSSRVHDSLGFSR